MATADITRLVRAALQGLGRVYQAGFRYKKAGVVCLDLHKANAVQGGLFNAADTPARIELMGAIDALNKRYGRDTVAIATAGTRKAWALRSDQRSPAYTTRWNELLAV